MLIRMLTRDPALVLRTGTHVEELSKVQTEPSASEQLFKAFIAHLDLVAARNAQSQPAIAASR
jgi:tRNA U55 pseudouridine synthase TruB